MSQFTVPKVTRNQIASIRRQLAKAVVAVAAPLLAAPRARGQSTAERRKARNR